MKFFNLKNDQSPIMNVIYSPLSDNRSFDIVVWSDKKVSKETMVNIMAQVDVLDGCLDEEEGETIEDLIEGYKDRCIVESYDMEQVEERQRYIDDLKNSGLTPANIDHQLSEELSDQIYKNTQTACAHWWDAQAREKRQHLFPERGCIYIGKVEQIDPNGRWVSQRCGESLELHTIKELDRLPEVGEQVKISYPEDPDILATVKTIERKQERSRGR